MQLFSCEFCEISKNTFFHRTPQVAAFVHKSSERLVYIQYTSCIQGVQLCLNYLKIEIILRWQLKIISCNKLLNDDKCVL